MRRLLARRDRLGQQQPDAEPGEIGAAQHAHQPGEPLELDQHGRQAEQAERGVEAQADSNAEGGQQARPRSARHRRAHDAHEIGPGQDQRRYEDAKDGQQDTQRFHNLLRGLLEIIRRPPA